MRTSLSLHAQERIIDWNITHADVDFIVEHAKKTHNAGAILFQFRRKDMPERHAHDSRYQRLIGTTVIACKHCGTFVITVYRNDNAFKTDRKKRKHDIIKRSRNCPCCNKHHDS